MRNEWNNFPMVAIAIFHNFQEQLSRESSILDWQGPGYAPIEDLHLSIPQKIVFNRKKVKRNVK